MNPFDGLENDIATRLIFAMQGFLILFVVISPAIGKLMHQAIARASSLVLIVCTMILVGNLIYMGMIYVAYPALPDDAIHPYIWVILSFCTSFSITILLGRYLNWQLSDNFSAAIWTKEYEELTDDEMLPFDRKRKREMERRKRALHQD